MNGLALCTGVCGLEQGLRIALGPIYRTLCYVEREAYAAAILAARMEDQTLDPAPIWDDLSTFSVGALRVGFDVVSAGFPCQPFSAAGNRKGKEDPRWLWPHIERIIRDVRPRFVFLENVTGLALQGLDDVLGSLAGLGFDAEWDCFTARHSGAPHRRRRIFILAWMADTDRGGLSIERRENGVGKLPRRGEFDGRHVPQWPPDPSDVRSWRRVRPEAQPTLCGVVDGIPNRMDRLRALGNAVVPIVAARAFVTLASKGGIW